MNTPVLPIESPRTGARKSAVFGDRFFCARWLVGASLLLALPQICQALPSFARQLNMQCIACHTEFPILTDMGRQFKLSGYTMSAEQSDLPPIAVMLMPSFTETHASQPGGTAPGFGNNDNYAMTQASIFYAGRLFGPYASRLFGADASSALNKIGIFSQTTYDGVAKTWSWDNTEVRYGDVGSVGNHSLLYGFYLNNNPTMQDLWNTTPAWGFPFSGSGLAPTPAAAPMIDDTLGGTVAGLGGYAMVDSHFYLDFALYRTLGASFQRSVGVDPADDAEISGVAPYWRLAYTKPVGDASIETGLFGLSAGTYPGRDQSAGKDTVNDVGADFEYQKSDDRSDVTALVSAVREYAKWDASQALGNTANHSDSLTEFKATINYLYDKTYGFSGQWFDVTGTNDPVAYATSVTGSPDSNGFVLQADYLPFNKGTGPDFWPRSNVKFSVQYVIYNRFDGSASNIDGAGRSARDNNTIYLEAWVVF